MTVTISAEQRDALYERALAELRGFEDLLAAVDARDMEAAYRRGRRFLDALRLIQEELGWGEHPDGSRDLRTIAPRELSKILGRVRDDAIVDYERERPEQEQHRTTWEETALVRDTCDQVVQSL